MLKMEENIKIVLSPLNEFLSNRIKSDLFCLLNIYLLRRHTLHNILSICIFVLFSMFYIVFYFI